MAASCGCILIDLPRRLTFTGFSNQPATSGLFSWSDRYWGGGCSMFGLN